MKEDELKDYSKLGNDGKNCKRKCTKSIIWNNCYKLNRDTERVFN